MPCNCNDHMHAPFCHFQSQLLPLRQFFFKPWLTSSSAEWCHRHRRRRHTRHPCRVAGRIPFPVGFGICSSRPSSSATIVSPKAPSLVAHGSPLSRMAPLLPPPSSSTHPPPRWSARWDRPKPAAAGVAVAAHAENACCSSVVNLTGTWPPGGAGNWP